MAQRESVRSRMHAIMMSRLAAAGKIVSPVPAGSTSKGEGSETAQGKIPARVGVEVARPPIVEAAAASVEASSMLQDWGVRTSEDMPQVAQASLAETATVMLQTQSEEVIGEKQRAILDLLEESVHEVMEEVAISDPASPQTILSLGPTPSPAPRKRVRVGRLDAGDYRVDSALEERLESEVKRNNQLQDINAELIREVETLKARISELESIGKSSERKEDNQSAWLARLAGALREISQRAPLGQDKRDLIELQAQCLMQSFDVDSLPACNVEDRESMAEKMQLLKAMVENFHNQRQESTIEWQRKMEKNLNGYGTRIKHLEDGQEYTRKVLLPTGGKTVDDWAKVKAAQTETAYVVAAREGWLKSSVLTDPKFRAHIPYRRDEVAIALLEDKPHQQSV